MRISDEVARGAARWWAKNLNGVFDNGDHFTNAMAATFSSLAGGPYRPTADERQRFEDALFERIRDQAPPFFLRVDYDPDHTLVGAAIEAGFGDAVRNSLKSPFPVKSGMRVYVKHAEAALGYAARFEVVAGTRPMCLETEIAPGVVVTTQSDDDVQWTTSPGLYPPPKSTFRGDRWVISIGADAARRAHERTVAIVCMACDRCELPHAPRSDRSKRLFEMNDADAIAMREQTRYQDAVAAIYYAEDFER